METSCSSARRTEPTIATRREGLLQIRGIVPLSEIRRPTQRNTSGDPAMPAIKNGLTTDTTVGW